MLASPLGFTSKAVLAGGEMASFEDDGGGACVVVDDVRGSEPGGPEDEGLGGGGDVMEGVRATDEVEGIGAVEDVLAGMDRWVGCGGLAFCAFFARSA